MQPVSWYTKKLKGPIEPLKRWTVRQIAAKKGSRALFNRFYESFSDDYKGHFERRYCKVFRSRGLFGGDGVPLAPGEWNVRFVGRKIRLPLRPSWAWLDWEHAVSIVGNDPEIVQTYAGLIESDQRPALFLDVGANYGMHSLLFLSAGIPVIAFEPNPTCFPHFQTYCELNGVNARWEQVAIGNESGQIELVYPEKDPWMGSIASEYVSTLKDFSNLITQPVPLKTLDAYIGDVPSNNVLIKIDVEGSEPEVIQGASQLLRHCRPKLIFESFVRDNVDVARSRVDLFKLFAERGYSVHSLPWTPSNPSQALDVSEFLASRGNNFIAIAQ